MMIPGMNPRMMKQAMKRMGIQQEDVDESFTTYHGDAAASTLTNNIVDEGDQSSETREGWLKITVTDDGNQVTDGAYFIPFYSLA